MTTIGGDVGNSISGGNFFGSVQQFFYSLYREALAVMALDPATVAQVRSTYVETPPFLAARTALSEQSAVVLAGPPGCGRRTTGIALLAALGVTPTRIVLDLEDLDRPLETLPSHGYLLDLDEDHDQLNSRIGSWLQDLALRLRAKGSCLVVRARAQSWKSLDLDEHALPVVPLTAPQATAVFRSHLTHWTSETVASAWERRDQVADLLRNVGPEDAVRLARIVRDVWVRAIPDALQLGEVLAEYRNWTDELTDWFSKTTSAEKGYERALLLAAAGLHGSSAATVFAAADRLAELVELQQVPGWPLTGEDVETLFAGTTAELRDGFVHFPKSAYAESVLDYIWTKRANLRGVVREWLASIPDPNQEDSWQAAYSLTDLAIRQREASLVCSASARWAKASLSLRAVGVAALTAAAMSEQIGQRVRRQLYEWATSATVPEEIHLAVAAVCQGPLASAYPQIALTRLRHLVIRRNPIVQEAAQEALAALSRIPALLHLVLSEVASWVEGYESRRSAGRRAFLRLARPDETGEIAILTARDEDVTMLAGLWWDALRHPDPDGKTADTLADWLEAVARRRAPRETVAEILARSCHTGIDLANLVGIVIGWTGTDAEPTGDVRRDIAADLVLRAYQHAPDAVPGANQAGRKHE